jgi:hypothetical protein
MRKILSLLIFISCILLNATPADASALKIIGPKMVIRDNNIIVNSGIHNVKELETTIKSGVAKEIVFTIELLRSLRFWPDDFVVSKQITRVIKYDNLREQYWASSYDGTSSSDRHFRNYNDMKDWIFTADSLNLANIRELEPGIYYIRVVVQTSSREHSPVVGFLMHLIPEVEMSLVKESEPFAVRRDR